MMNLLKTKKSPPVFISRRFEQAVVLHILKNFLKRVEVQVPLLMGIHGPSGEGKTYQVENVLKKMGVKRFLLSGGQLENPVAGQPAHLIRRTYIQASDAIRGGECSMAVMLINDVDTGLGSWGDKGRFTINQQTVFGELMHLVDYPNSVEGRETLRVPVIITGNDFTRLYEPLVRAGRMTAFEWLPTLEERSQIVSFIFPELSTPECQRLVLDLSHALHNGDCGPAEDLPVAFYSHLRSSLLDEDLWGGVEQTGVEKMVDLILRGDEPDFTLGVRYERVLEKGIQLACSGTLINHIKDENHR